jgi:hypothetical protein
MPVTFIKQNRIGLCGAACAQMVLHVKNLIGTSPVEQETLWTEIKERTRGRSNNCPKGSPCGKFDHQICECSGSVSACWCTHPDPLNETLLAHDPATAVHVIRRSDEDVANGRIKACLTRGGFPAVLVNSGKHWVVVDGFDENLAFPVSILNPALNGQISITLGAWNAEYMSVPTVGTLANKYVVVGADQ